jgi:ribosomal protein L40E
VIFILIATMTFWMRRNMEKAMERSKRDEGMPPMEGEVEKFICSECGAEVPADAKECPQCGERFEVEGVPETKPPEEPAKKGSFICSECGAEVSGEDDVCPNCGERFED